MSGSIEVLRPAAVLGTDLDRSAVEIVSEVTLELEDASVAFLDPEER